MSVQEFCVSCNVVDFDETAAFYTDVSKFTPSVSWDRADGRGAFFVGEGNGVVEIFTAARDFAFLHSLDPFRTLRLSERFVLILTR